MANLKRKNAVMAYTFDAPSRKMAWDFGSIGKVEFTLPECGLNPCDDAALHNGYKQKIGDSAALGQDATAAEKRDAMLATVEHLEREEWNAPRGEGDGGYLVRAIMEVDRKPAEKLPAVREYVKGLTTAQRRALESGEKYGETIAGYRKARAANVDLDETLDEIENL